eukprot:1663001-Rhodomonas_salina.2
MEPSQSMTAKVVCVVGTSTFLSYKFSRYARYSFVWRMVVASGRDLFWGYLLSVFHTNAQATWERVRRTGITKRCDCLGRWRVSY